ncbi:nuclear transport factor 2 family protein [Nocardia sp. NPDC049220]|uniref:nuclear transport factor 2 family protein n=1 Tax=Nocardia sp. NPDC049220 TaxID=3155273 RepID=UPI0033D9CCB5
MDRAAVEAWVAGYERAWRAPGTERLADLFTADAGYLISPWAEPLIGLTSLADFWAGGRDGPGEAFTMETEVVAVDWPNAVVRVEVEYAKDEPSRWRDLWVLRFDGDGRCAWFEEWPFAPRQPNGH